MAQSTVITKANINEKSMTLTFDAGSDAANTLSILNILASNNIKSTFFLTGEYADLHPESVNQILQKGHEIGNHSYSHPYMTQLNENEIKLEIENCKKAIMAATNTQPQPLFRPPYGEYNTTVLNAVGSIGYPWTIMWTIDTIDWNGTPAYTMVQKVLNNAQPGAIVLMHVASGTHTIEALPEIITGLKSLGYTLTTISKILSLNPAHSLLKMGDTGVEVKYLQESLGKLGYSPGPIDGIFGLKTETSVKLFQKAKGLSVDGIVGNNTWAAIDKNLQNTPAPSHPILRSGNTGEAVRYLQQSLSKLSYNPGPIDGIFGLKTETSVKLFQKAKGLSVDGIVGNNTWAAIDKDLQNPPAPSHPILKSGNTGEAVRYLQQSLSKLGYNPGLIDGIFGLKTETAVKLFQKAKGLVVDGIVGNNTWAAIDKSL